MRHWDLKNCAGLAKNTAATGHQAAGWTGCLDFGDAGAGQTFLFEKVMLE